MTLFEMYEQEKQGLKTHEGQVHFAGGGSVYG